jgi:hypothetical protein
VRGNRTVKLDGNHAEVVKALRGLPAAVKSLAIVGGGMPDLLVSFRGVTGVLEVKDGRLPPSARKLTADETEFHATWPGPIAIVTSPEEACRVVTEWARPRACPTCKPERESGE